MLDRYRVHKFDIRMTTDESKLEQFLNNLKGEVVAIFPNVTSLQLEYASVNFLFIIEKIA